MKTLYRIENGQRVTLSVKPKNVAKKLAKGWRVVEDAPKKGKAKKAAKSE
jgi:hypothetical protein